MPNLRCKAGDLAIVTKCTETTFIGLLVRVIERDANDGCDWVVEVQGRPIMTRTARSGAMRLCRKVVAYDWNLTPIRSDAETESSEEMEVRHA
jgi:hypothetical protein